MNRLNYAENVIAAFQDDAREPDVTRDDYENAIDAIADDCLDTAHDMVFELPFWKDHFDRWIRTDTQLRKALFDHKAVITRAAELAEKRAERQRESDAADAEFERSAA